VKKGRGGPAPPLAIDNVDVDVDVVVDLVVDTSGHTLGTDVSLCGLGSALGASGASYLQSLGRVQVDVHVHDDVQDHVATCPPDSFTSSVLGDGRPRLWYSWRAVRVGVSTRGMRKA
jgi:hypothetical protein